MQCPVCGQENPRAARVCRSCTAPLEGVPTPEALERGVPVRLRVSYPERLSRWRLFVKWLFVLPLDLVLVLFGFVSAFCVLLAFWAVLFTGRFPRPWFRLVRWFMVHQLRVQAYFPYLLTDRWNPAGSDHPVQYELDYPERLSRRVLLLLKLPAFLLSIVTKLAGFVSIFLILVAIPVWWVILVRGRYPRKLFGFNVAIFQWIARVESWQLLLRDDLSLFGTTRPVQALVAVGVVAVAVTSLPIPLRLPGLEDFETATTSALARMVPTVREGEETVREFMDAGLRARD